MNCGAAYFADTWFWIARINQRDAHHARALGLQSKIGHAPIVTTEMVLTELLNMFSGKGSYWRAKCCAFVQLLRTSKTVIIVPQTAAQFQSGLTIYCQHRDKKWSHTDCSSFDAMRTQHIEIALTNDDHFSQAGFTLAT